MSSPPTEQQYVVPLTEIKRLQDHAFAVGDELTEIQHAARRTLRCLRGYWYWVDRDKDWELLWWTAFERWADTLAALCDGESPA